MMRCSHCQVEGEKFNEAPTALRSFLDQRYEVRQTQNSALIYIDSLWPKRLFYDIV